MSTNRFNPFPILTTERLIFRRITPEDVQSIYIMRNDDIVTKYIVRVKMTNITEAQAWIARINKSIDEGQNINWAITLKDTGKFIGNICLWNFLEDRSIAETGYELLPAHHCKGYMSEALLRVVDYGFSELNLKTITAYTHTENSNSRKLLEKNGFVWNEGEIDEGFPHNVIYSISK